MVCCVIVVGVEWLFMLNIDLDFVVFMYVLEVEFFGYCYFMMGLYFCLVDGNYLYVFVEMKKMFDICLYVVVGEMGIDLYWDKIFLEE